MHLEKQAFRLHAVHALRLPPYGASSLVVQTARWSGVIASVDGRASDPEADPRVVRDGGSR